MSQNTLTIAAQPGFGSLPPGQGAYALKEGMTDAGDSKERSSIACHWRVFSALN